MSTPVYYGAAADYSLPELKNTVAETVAPVIGSVGGIAGKRVLLKPNLLFCRKSDDPAAVHPAMITAVAEVLKEYSPCEITLMENPGTQRVKAIIDHMGIGPKLEKLGIKYLDFSDYRELTLPENASFRNLKAAGEFENFDLTVDLAKAKTHAMMTLTLAVKNLFGLVDSADRIAWHLAVGSDFGRFADLLLDLYLTVNPRINIIDGIIGMEGNGPGSGTPVNSGFIAASGDALALDASVAEQLGVSEDLLMILERARTRGLDFSFQNFGTIPEIRPFKLPDPPGRLNAWGVTLPPFFKTGLRNLIGSRPFLNQEDCISCGRCVEVCPPRSLKLGRKKLPVFDLNHCIRCYCCQEHCPKGAIVTKVQLLTACLEKAVKLFKK